MPCNVCGGSAEVAGDFVAYVTSWGTTASPGMTLPAFYEHITHFTFCACIDCMRSKLVARGHLFRKLLTLFGVIAVAAVIALILLGFDVQPHPIMRPALVVLLICVFSIAGTLLYELILFRRRLRELPPPRPQAAHILLELWKGKVYEHALTLDSFFRRKYPPGCQPGRKGLRFNVASRDWWEKAMATRR